MCNFTGNRSKPKITTKGTPPRVFSRKSFTGWWIISIGTSVHWWLRYIVGFVLSTPISRYRRRLTARAKPSPPVLLNCCPARLRPTTCMCWLLLDAVKIIKTIHPRRFEGSPKTSFCAAHPSWREINELQPERISLVCAAEELASACLPVLVWILHTWPSAFPSVLFWIRWRIREGFPPKKSVDIEKKRKSSPPGLRWPYTTQRRVCLMC